MGIEYRLPALIRRFQAKLHTPVWEIQQYIPFNVVCGTRYLAIGCALMQYHADDAMHVICYQSLQVQPDERNYPFHDKELLAMKYELANSESIF